jgi:hypothetical protein
MENLLPTRAHYIHCHSNTFQSKLYRWHASCHWPVGLMDKASASGAGDSRFESWAGHIFNSFPIREHWQDSTRQSKDPKTWQRVQSNPRAASTPHYHPWWTMTCNACLQPVERTEINMEEMIVRGGQDVKIRVEPTMPRKLSTSRPIEHDGRVLLFPKFFLVTVTGE